MKLILSRKGFDSSAGGSASPILPDGRLLSLPIPDGQSPVCFGDINEGDHDLGTIVEQLSRGKITRSMGAHLDPDLHAPHLKRLPGWQPLFGQMGAAEGHLRRHKIGPGDIFLFFGWFRRAVRVDGCWRYQKQAPDAHLLFGWFQIDRMLPLGEGTEALSAWAQHHPHCFGERGKNNTLYVGKRSLALPIAHPHLPGCGRFSRVAPELILSRGEKSRCQWALPGWFHPQNRASCLSYHERPERWCRVGDQVHLHSVARGQEFVLDLDHYPEALPWLLSLLKNS